MQSGFPSGYSTKITGEKKGSHSTKDEVLILNANKNRGTNSSAPEVLQRVTQMQGFLQPRPQLPKVGGARKADMAGSFRSFTLLAETPYYGHTDFYGFS